MPPFHDYRDGGLLVLDPAAAALFGGVRQQRKRARVTAVAPSVFAAAAAAAAAAEVGLAKKRKLREAPSPDALPDACLFEVLRRVQGARARGASACVSRRWLALLGGIRASEIKRAVPDLNQAFVADDDEDEDVPASARPGRSERSLEGERATDVALTAAAVADSLRGHLESLVVRGSHPTRGVTDDGLSAVARGCSSLRSLALCVDFVARDDQERCSATRDSSFARRTREELYKATTYRRGRD